MKTNSEQTYDETDDGHFPGGAGEVVERDSLGHHFGGSHVVLMSVKGRDVVRYVSGIDCVISQGRGLVYG